MENNCPKCGEPIKIPPRVFRNLESYRSDYALSISECCGNAFVVKIITSFKITEYTGEKEEDDWGEKITKKRT